eukprot:Rhum_TRINITY_DN14247_c15_g10::Rhum_TRINITY_DN14247_c15_g10_i1::g.77246::m.77246
MHRSRCLPEKKLPICIWFPKPLFINRQGGWGGREGQKPPPTKEKNKQQKYTKTQQNQSTPNQTNTNILALHHPPFAPLLQLFHRSHLQLSSCPLVTLYPPREQTIQMKLCTFFPNLERAPTPRYTVLLRMLYAANGTHAFHTPHLPIHNRSCPPMYTPQRPHANHPSHNPQNTKPNQLFPTDTTTNDPLSLPHVAQERSVTHELQAPPPATNTAQTPLSHSRSHSHAPFAHSAPHLPPWCPPPQVTPTSARSLSSHTHLPTPPFSLLPPPPILPSPFLFCAKRADTVHTFTHEPDPSLPWLSGSGSRASSLFSGDPQGKLCDRMGLYSPSSCGIRVCWFRLHKRVHGRVGQ